MTGKASPLQAAAVAAVLAACTALAFGPGALDPAAADQAPPAPVTALADAGPAAAGPEAAPAGAAPTAVATDALPAAPAVPPAPGTGTLTEPAPGADLTGPSTALDATATATPDAAASVPPAPAALTVTHSILAPIPGPGSAAQYAGADEGVTGVEVGQKVRVGFQLVNDGSLAASAAPLLEFRAGSAGEFLPVPEDFESGAPLRLSPEWVTVDGGTAYGPDEAELAAGDLHIAAAGGTAVTGSRSMRANPAEVVSLGPGTFTEQEFTVSVTSDAQPTSYELRLRPDASGAQTPLARFTVLAPVPAELSPGQQDGADVDPAPELATEQAPPMYRLRAAAVQSTAVQPDDVHGPYSVTTGRCATCHRTHTAKSEQLLAQPGSLSSMCLVCHDGTGARSNVAAQYAAAKPNDPATRSYFQHDALTRTTGANAHTLAVDAEFGGVLNRHSECTDCHNAHSARSTAPTAGDAGWTASGRLRDVSGVTVTNGSAGTIPSYTWFSSQPEGTPSLEYQICFKCHSGYTNLPSNAGFPASQHLLDKGVELNPANASYHPIEAAGKNATAAMAASLAGTSPYKLWNFSTTSTIRCSNCHADPGAIGGGAAADADLPGHTSANRGLLLANYRDRVLKPGPRAGVPAEPYQAADFALCYLCHAEQPYRLESSSATNFTYHFKHLNDISGGTSSTDIDTPGAGNGRAICAECHFRTHSTEFKVGNQQIPGSRLVNFAPDVQPITVSGVTYQPTFTRSGTRGSCTLTCHGARHFGWGY